MTPSEYTRYIAVGDRDKAIKALAEMKKTEAILKEKGKLVKVKLPHDNGVAYTNTPEEFERKIRENDFFTV